MYSFGMVGYITIILLAMGAVFLLATKAVGTTIRIFVYVCVILFIFYILRSYGII